MRIFYGTILAAVVACGAYAAYADPEVSWSIMHPTGIDVKYMERVAAKAAEYGGVDSFEVCGPCHSPDGGINGLSMLEPYPKAHARVDAAAVETARAKLNAIVSIAHGIGKPIYYWHREIFLQPGIIEDLPQMLDEDGEFDLLGSTYQDYLRFKIKETFKFVPGLDGIVLTLTEADYSVIHNSNPERYPPAKVVEAIVRIFAEEHAKRGKKFILRSFGSIPKDYEDIIAGAVAVAGDYAFEIETKVTQADFVPWLPKNPFLKKNPPLTLGAECDGVGEYLGAGYLPSVQVSRIYGYVADARAEGADRFTIRIDRVGNSIFDTAAEANLYAYMRFIKDPGATVEGVLEEYAAKHYGDAAKEMAKLEGTELEMVCNLHYVASNLTFHTFPIRPDFKYVKAGGIFGAYHENADLSNCRGSWSMLYWQKAPTHEQMLAEKAKGFEMAERGLALVKSLRGRLPQTEYPRVVRAWENAVRVARALQAYTRCVVAYFEDMKAGRDVPAGLEAASSEAVKLIESMMHNPNAVDDDTHHPVTEDGSIDFAYFVGLRFFCRELLAEYRAERAARRTLQNRLDVIDFIVPGGIYDDGRVMRPMHGAHSEIVNGWPVRWVGNAVFPNGTITVEFKDVPGAKLEITLDPSGSQEFKCSESVEAGRRKVMILKKGASYPGIRSISLCAGQTLKLKSSSDGTEQPLFWYDPGSPNRVPLIVALHTWSSDYRNPSPAKTVAAYCRQKGWTMVYPNFRGPNNRPEACGSNFAVQDIVDAIAWAKNARAIDENRIYIIGGSGGGHMALLMAGRHSEIFAGAVAFCPITDIARWHGESLEKHPGRGANYARMMESACGGTPAERSEEYAHRSPLTWLSRAREAGVPVYVATGIHDGWWGSVPVGHAIRAFNALGANTDVVSEADIGFIERNQAIPASLKSEADVDPFYDEKMRIHFRRTSGNVRLTLFEGGHSMNFPAGLDFLSRQRKGVPADWTLPFKGSGGQEALTK